MKITRRRTAHKRRKTGKRKMHRRRLRGGTPSRITSVSHRKNETALMNRDGSIPDEPVYDIKNDVSVRLIQNLKSAVTAFKATYSKISAIAKNEKFDFTYPYPKNSNEMLKNINQYKEQPMPSKSKSKSFSLFKKSATSLSKNEGVKQGLFADAAKKEEQLISTIDAIKSINNNFDTDSYL